MSMTLFNPPVIGRSKNLKPGTNSSIAFCQLLAEASSIFKAILELQDDLPIANLYEALLPRSPHGPAFAIQHLYETIHTIYSIAHSTICL
jgi:hypothetical protein